jgi:hypothetical protein
LIHQSSGPFSPWEKAGMRGNPSLRPSPLLGERVSLKGEPVVTVTTAEAFIPELRSGLYSTAIITGESTEIDSSLIGELGLFVRRGNELLVFDDNGNLATTLELLLDIEVASGSSHYVDILEIVPNDYMATGSWRIDAEVPAVTARDAEVIGQRDGIPVITVRSIGCGHAIYVGTSLYAADGAFSEAICTAFVPSPRGEAQLGPAPLGAGGEGKSPLISADCRPLADGGARVVVVRVHATGEGRAQIREKLADGITVIDHGGAEISGPTLSWYLTVDSQGRVIEYSLVLPNVCGSYRLDTELRPLEGGVYRVAKKRVVEVSVAVEAREALEQTKDAVGRDAELSSSAATHIQAALEKIAGTHMYSRYTLDEMISTLGQLSFFLERERAGPEIQDKLSELVGIYEMIWSYWAQGGVR